MKKRLLRFLILVLLLGGGYAAYHYWQLRQAVVDTGMLTLYGNVDIREVQLAINGSERIDRMLVKEGDRVHQGDLLAVLDLGRLQAQVALAEARVAAQQQVVARLLAGSRPEEIRAARANVEAGRATAIDARLTYERLRKLLDRKLVSPEDVDNAKATADAAHARLKASEEALKLAIAGPRKEDIAAGQATLKADQAALALAHHNLDDASLYAPSNGVIRDRILEPGDMANPSRPVYTLARDNPVWVRAYVSETDLGRVKPGQAATIHTDSYPGKGYPGWVGYISPTSEFTPKSVQTEALRTHLVYQLRVYACNPERELRLGMPATVVIDEKVQAAPATGDCGQPE